MPSRISLHTISGHVLASNRRPISDASVSLDGKIVAHSGNDGYFSVDVGKPSTRVALTFAIDGFVSNTRVYNSMEGSGHLVVMWPIAYRVKFDPSRDLDVELGLSRIEFPQTQSPVLTGTNPVVPSRSNTPGSMSQARCSAPPHRATSQARCAIEAFGA